MIADSSRWRKNNNKEKLVLLPLWIYSVWFNYELHFISYMATSLSNNLSSLSNLSELNIHDNDKLQENIQWVGVDGGGRWGRREGMLELKRRYVEFGYFIDNLLCDVS